MVSSEPSLAIESKKLTDLTFALDDYFKQPGCIWKEIADVAQLVEHLIRNEGVTGSNPVVGSSLFLIMLLP